MELTAQQLWEKINSGDEIDSIEVKTASQVGKSILDTISAFSNEPDLNGGYLFLGAEKKEKGLFFGGYSIRAIKDPDQIQSDIATKCNDLFSSPIRPKIVVDEIDGKCVVVVYIPEADPHKKPVYIKSRGTINGSYRRIGPTDTRCKDDDLAVFFQARGNRTFDQSVVDGTSVRDIDPHALKAYRSARKLQSLSSDLNSMSDRELLYALHATGDETSSAPLTLAGLALFGRPSVIRRFLPMTRVDYIRVEGNEWVQSTSQRYTAIERIGPLVLTIPQLINSVLDDIPKAFSLPDSEVYRQDKPLVPKKVVREAIVNALMHRSYQIDQPIQIIRFSNRVEILNAGYSLVSDDRLGEAGSRLRNPKIAAVLHEIGLAETKGTGIKVMRKSMITANLSSPLIESDRERNEFRISLLVHHFMSESDVKWLSRFSDCNLSPDEARALIFLRELKEIDNARYRQINDMSMSAASCHLKRLRDLKLLEKRGKGAKTKYRAGERFFQKTAKNTRKTSSKLEPLTDAQSEELAAISEELPDELLKAIEDLKKRKTKDLDEIIVRMCGIRPFSAVEIGLVIRRSVRSLRDRTIKKLVTKGELELLHENEPNHPNQKYVSAIIKN